MSLLWGTVGVSTTVVGVILEACSGFVGDDMLFHPSVRRGQ